MSDHSTMPAESVDKLFTPAEMKQFDADDAQAGAAIGKMLSLFFLYTVIVMGISTIATYWWVTTVTIR
jgi:hypothetical protein